MNFSATSSFLLVALLVSIAIGAYSIWLAWRRPNRKRLVWRMAASLTAVICLALLALQPSVRQPVSLQAAILLTNGASVDSLEALLKTQAALPVYMLDSLATQSFPNVRVQSVPDVAYLRRNFPPINQLHVLGYGLPDYELAQLDSVRITWHPTPLPAGVERVQWTEKVNLGEPLRLQGTYQNGLDTAVQLILTGFGTAMDSVIVAGKQSASFALQTIPKETGRFVYNLKIRLGTDTLREEKIPVEVRPARPLQLLLLESFPNFETKFLKKWLSEQQHHVVVRSEISRNKFRTEFLNTEKTGLNRLSPILLKQFDVILTDSETFRQLNNRETAALRQAVTRTGLGLVIQVAAPVSKIGKPGSFTSGFLLQTLPDVDFLRVVPSWQNAPGNITATNIPPAEITYTSGTQPLIRDAANRILTSVQQQGQGKVAVSLLVNTYTWALEGNSHYHAAYWTFLLNQLARREVVREEWKVAPQLPAVDQPITISLQTTADQLPVSTVQHTEVYWQQQLMNPNQWHGTYWPRNAGWQQMTTNGKPFWWYAFAQPDWTDLQWRQHMLATREFMHKQAALGKQKVGQANVIFRREPVSLLWFFLGFLFSSGYLWLERKL